MKDEMRWRKDLAIVVPVFFLVGFVIYLVTSFFTYDSFLYEHSYGYSANITLGGYAMGMAVAGGYTFAALLSGIMFTVKALGEAKTGTKVVLTIFFVVPLFLAVLGVIYAIPYYICNLVKLAALKHKSKKEKSTVYANTHQYTAPNINFPVGGSYPQYDMPSPRVVRENTAPAYKREEAVQSEVPLAGEYTAAAKPEKPESDADKGKKSTKAEKGGLSEDIEDMEIYEKPYEKPSEKFVKADITSDDDQEQMKDKQESEQPKGAEKAPVPPQPQPPKAEPQPPRAEPQPPRAEPQPPRAEPQPPRAEPQHKMPVYRSSKRSRFTVPDDNPYGDGF